MAIAQLYWLPKDPELNDVLRLLSREGRPRWAELVRLANVHLDFVQTNRLDKILQKFLAADDNDAAPWRRLRLAVLGSSTIEHLLPAIRIAALRRGFLMDTFQGDYGTYFQELQSETSALFAFQPDVILFAFNAAHVIGAAHPAMSAAEADDFVSAAGDRIANNWALARRHFKGQIIQQSVLPVFQPLLGQNEGRLPGSAAHLVERLNLRIDELAATHAVDVLSLQTAIVRDGLDAWHDPVLWHRAKQEVSPLAAPAYGELLGRLVAAQQGRSAKCLVLDLDNTLWGGVIGDDGLEGIKLGQGSAVGEAYVEFQTYVRDLGRRGVILAVCSKNDIEQARLPFEQHPDMVLKLEDIACFVANWSDKAGNIRSIAEQLNIGLDSLVLVDDNPFERNIVRRELPMVGVPELPEDAAFYSRCVADAGHFEVLGVTPEDFERGGQYRANLQREIVRASHTDLEGYLRSLDMELRWRSFDSVGLLRIVQLINKTNQFNLTTRRYTESDVLAVMSTPGALTLQLRLIDRFGDNGIIGIVIGTPEGDALHLDIWLMSCRVLGRQVEEATMNLVVAQARGIGAARLLGEYLPTKKNGMVKDHYRKLGFSQLAVAADGASRWQLSVADYKPFDTFISLVGSTS